MSDYTPGPWHMENSGVWWITASHRNGWKGDHYMAVSGQISEADALLIAAAPDLLEALKEAYRSIVGDPAWNGNSFIPLKQRIYAAIAKVEAQETTP